MPIGLDISDRSIEAVGVQESADGVFMSACARVELPSGIIERGIIKKQPELISALQAVQKQIGADFSDQAVVFGIPESRVYLYHLEFPSSLSSESLEKAILYEVSTTLSPALENQFHNFFILESNNEKQWVLYIGAEKSFINAYQALFNALGWKSVTFDIESMAVARGTLGQIEKDEAYAFLDIGANTALTSIFDRVGMRFSRSSNVAGNRLTQGLSDALKIPISDAEDKKIKIGLNKSVDPVMFDTLSRALEPLFFDVHEALRFYEASFGRKVKKVFLCGGTALMRGLLTFASEHLPLPVEIAKTWVQERGVDQQSPLYYLEAIGLALSQRAETLFCHNFRFTEGSKQEKSPGVWKTVKKIFQKG